MRKIVFFLLCCALLCSVALGADYTVSRLSVDATVKDSGIMSVTQEILLSFPSPVRQITIPLGKDVTDASVSAHGAEISLFSRDGGTYATLTFADDISGELPVTAIFAQGTTAQDGEDGLTSTAVLVSSLWECKVERVNFTVVYPSQPKAEPLFLGGYDGQDLADRLTIASKGQVVSGVLRGGLRDRDSLTAQALLPKGAILLPGESGRSILTLVCAILSVVLTILGGVYWFKTLRNKPLRVQARTTAPESLTPGELRFLLCGGKISFGLLVCYWGVLGYLTITENSAGRILLRKCMDMGTERREEERKLFSVLFGTSDVCEGGGSRYCRAAELSQKAFPRYWYRRLYEKRTGAPVVLTAVAVCVCALAVMASMDGILGAVNAKWLYLLISFPAGGFMGWALICAIRRRVLRDDIWVPFGAVCFLALLLLGFSGGAFLLMVLALATAIFVGFATTYGGKKTPTGMDFMERTMGFARFLRHAEPRHLRQMLERDGQYFYSALLYAISGGVGRSFARRFGDMKLEDCQWLTMAKRSGLRAYAHYVLFSDLLRKLDV